MHVQVVTIILRFFYHLLHFHWDVNKSRDPHILGYMHQASHFPGPGHVCTSCHTIIEICAQMSTLPSGYVHKLSHYHLYVYKLDGVTLGGGWTFCQNFSYLAISVWAGKWFEDLEEKDRWITQLISDKAVYRTAPATPGLLITQTIIKWII